MNLSAKPKVVVGMSGGVDSSMAAALLKDEGYEVIGVTLEIWTEGPQVESGCSSVTAVEDARKVAGLLDIPHYVLNFRTHFEKRVIDYFTEAYFSGLTPNPCLTCNRYVKFGELLEQARNFGAEYIATGHYASVKKDNVSGRYLLQRGLDDRKDQTYALYMLTQEQLSHALFPLAKYNKEEIRKMAHERGLVVVADKPDSQEICFVTDDDYVSFLKKREGKRIKPGNFVDKSGNILGTHQGIIHYTIGQRKGLGITFGKPMYVIGLNPERNEVILGEDNEVYTDTLWANDLNWIAVDKLTEPVKVEAKIRYTAKPAPATIYPEIDEDNGDFTREYVKVIFEKPQRAVTPGQSVVFYKEDIVIGGGIIVADPRDFR